MNFDDNDFYSRQGHLQSMPVMEAPAEAIFPDISFVIDSIILLRAFLPGMRKLELLYYAELSRYDLEMKPKIIVVGD